MARRILVVDDSAVARRVARKSLEARGVEVLEASSLAEALTFVTQQIDGALLDLELGDGTGLQVFDALPTAKIRANAAFVSAATEEPLLAEARSRARLFTKPAGVVAAIEWLLR